MNTRGFLPRDEVITEENILEICRSEFNALQLFFIIRNFTSTEIANFINNLNIPDDKWFMDAPQTNAIYILGKIKGKIYKETGKTLVAAVYPTINQSQDGWENKLIYLLLKRDTYETE